MSMLPTLVLGVLVALTVQAQPLSAQEPLPRRIVVIGTGEVAAPPDVAVIRAGVVVQSETASTALAENSRAMDAMLAQLRAAGLAPKDIQTSRFVVTPLYEARRPEQRTRQPPVIFGYQVANQVTARVHDLDRLGATLDALVNAGANSIDGPHFQLADPTELLGEARDAAVADALAKARRYATAAGVQLGAIISIEDGGSATPRPMMMRAADAASTSVPIAPGETELSASVTITFAID